MSLFAAALTATSTIRIGPIRLSAITLLELHDGVADRVWRGHSSVAHTADDAYTIRPRRQPCL